MYWGKILIGCACESLSNRRMPDGGKEKLGELGEKSQVRASRHKVTK